MTADEDGRLTEADVDLIIEAAHPSRPDREALVRSAVDRIVAAREDRARAEGAAQVLRDTADAWTQGAWSDVMLPKPTTPAVPVIAYANRVGDWLRERADRLDAEAGGDRD